MTYLYLKAIHIIFVVTWFAGLFYIVRLFVYYAEAAHLPETEKTILQKQYLLMQKRLWYGITWPSAVITAFMGLFLGLQLGTIPDWLAIKLVLVALLYGYHFLCHYIFKQQQQGNPVWNSTQFRIWNEASTLFLVSIVFIVVLKSLLSLLWGILGLAVFTVAIMSAIFVYKKIRETGKGSNKI